MTWGMIGAAGIGAATSIGSSFLNKGGKDRISTNTSDTWNQSVSSPVGPAKRYWKEQLEKWMGVQSGITPVSDLPEFQRSAGQINVLNDQSMQRLVKLLGAKGIMGGAAGHAIGNAQTGASQSILKLLQDIYGMAGAKADAAAGKLGTVTTSTGHSTGMQTAPGLPAQPLQTPDLTGLFAAALQAYQKSPQLGAGGPGGITSSPGGLGGFYNGTYGPGAFGTGIDLRNYFNK